MLHEKQLISDTDYETATYNYEKAKAAYDQSQASMVKVNRNLEYATITSPIDGVVINRAVEEGQRFSITVDAYPNDQFEGVVRQIRLGDSESTSALLPVLLLPRLLRMR